MPAAEAATLAVSSSASAVALAAAAALDELLTEEAPLALIDTPPPLVDATLPRLLPAESEPGAKDEPEPALAAEVATGWLWNSNLCGPGAVPKGMVRTAASSMTTMTSVSKMCENWSSMALAAGERTMPAPA